MSKDLRGFCQDALGIAAFITISMTALTWLVDQDPEGGIPQVVMYWLSMPARILFIFSGPEHYDDREVGGTRIMICFLTSIQWLCLGVGTGLAVAFVRMLVKKT
jgi:hypothetical protein